MILLLSQFTSEADTLRKDWSEMNCLELNEFFSSTRYQLLSSEENEAFHKAVESCRDG